MSVKISELPILSSLADNDVIAGVDTSANVTSKIEMATLKNYIDTNTQYTAGTNIDITNNVVSAPNVYNKTETNNLLNAKENISNKVTTLSSSSTNTQYPSAKVVYDELNNLETDLTNDINDLNDEVDNQIQELEEELKSVSTIYNAFPTESGEGESVTLDDTAEVKFKKFDLKGNTSQTGTPTPTSPIPVNVVSGDNEINVVGKNLLDTTQPDVVDFTSNWQKSAMSLNNNLVLKAGSYTMSLNIKSASGKVFNKISFIDVDNNEYTWTIYTAIPTTYTSYSHTFTFNNDIVVKRIDCQNGGDGSETFYLNNIQLEVGSTATTYEPYQGKTYNIDLPVENLFDKDNANYVNGWIDGTTMRLNTTNGNRMFYIPCKPNTTYTISRSVITSSFRTTTYDSTSFPTATSSNVDYTVGSVLKNDNGTTLTITTNANAKYLVVHYGKVEDTNLNETLATMQVEYGSKQNTFTPYGTTPIELCKIGTYQDYFYKDSDKWYLHKEITKYIFTGNETGILQNSGKRFDITCSANNMPICINNSASSEISQIYCNILLASSGASTWGGNQGISYNTGTNGQILVSISGATTTQAYLNALKDNYCYYILATPIDEPVEYQPLIDQLNLLEKAISYDSQTNISQVNNDLGFIIYAEAIKSLENVLDRLALVEE